MLFRSRLRAHGLVDRTDGRGFNLREALWKEPPSEICRYVLPVKGLSREGNNMRLVGYGGEVGFDCRAVSQWSNGLDVVRSFQVLLNRGQIVLRRSTYIDHGLDGLGQGAKQRLQSLSFNCRKLPVEPFAGKHQRVRLMALDLRDYSSPIALEVGL